MADKEGEGHEGEGHEGEGEKTKPPAGTVTVDAKELRDTIREIVADVIDGSEGEGDGGDGSEDEKTNAPRSIAQQENVTADQVRRAVEQLADEKDVKDRLQKVEKAIEKVPGKVRKLTTWVWGREEAS